MKRVTGHRSHINENIYKNKKNHPISSNIHSLATENKAIHSLWRGEGVQNQREEEDLHYNMQVQNGTGSGIQRKSSSVVMLHINYEIELKLSWKMISENDVSASFANIWDYVSGKNYWLGGENFASGGLVFEWHASKKSLSYTNWAPTQPDDTHVDICVMYWSDDTYSPLKWADNWCYEHHGFICERV